MRPAVTSGAGRADGGAARCVGAEPLCSALQTLFAEISPARLTLRANTLTTLSVPKWCVVLHPLSGWGRFALILRVSGR